MNSVSMPSRPVWRARSAMAWVSGAIRTATLPVGAGSRGGGATLGGRMLPALDDTAHGLPRARRLSHALSRDGEHCVWCRRPLPDGHRDASLEHVVPKVKGGPAWPENEVA